MNTQIYAEACDWFIQFRAGDMEAAERKRFDAWIRRSPEHLRAYLEITEIWQDSAFVAAPEHTTAGLLEEAAANGAGDVIPLAARQVRDAGEQWKSHRSRVRIRPYTWAAAAVVSFVLVWVGEHFHRNQNTFSTATGEQRAINLADGSTIELNAQSRIRIHYSAQVRGVELLQGQALFHVAKDKARPFIVKSDDTQVRAVGTQFDVYRRASGTTVTVVEGVVAVSSSRSLSGADQLPGRHDGAAEGPVIDATHVRPANSVPAALPGAILLAAGEQATVKSDAPSRVQKSDVSTAIAWTRHQLVFKASPLASVAEEFNRYNTRRLVIEGPGFEDFLISGVYSSTDPEVLLRFLKEQPGVRVEETAEAILISRVP